MITRKIYSEVQQKAIGLIEKAGLYIDPAVKEKNTVADFSFSNIYIEGIDVLTFL